MALWGNKDSKTAAGTVSITTAGAVTGTGTAFTTAAKIGNTMTVTGTEYQIVAIADDTHCTVIAGTNNGNGTVTAKTAQSYALSEKPCFVAHESAETAGLSGNSSKVFGVNESEAGVASNRAKGIKTAGWVRYNTYTDAQGNTRNKSEVLVAGGSFTAAVTGDAADDAVVADAP
jgi:hypothetical protein